MDRRRRDDVSTLQMEGIMTFMSGPEQWYLLQLRVLGAWWCLGSSALEPHLLLRYSLAPSAAFHTVPV